MPFELRPFVLLIFGGFAQLFRRIRSPFLQILWRWQKAFVLCRLPLRDVVVGDDGHAASDQDLVTAGVIEMVMTVDGKLDGKFCQRLDFADEFFHCGGREERVKDQHTFIADDKAGIA